MKKVGRFLHTIVFSGIVGRKLVAGSTSASRVCTLVKTRVPRPKPEVMMPAARPLFSGHHAKSRPTGPVYASPTPQPRSAP